MRAIRKHLRDAIAIVVLVVLAALVSVVILSNERLTLPSWVPGIGSSFYKLKGEFTTAQAVTPGQGQSVDIAGVPVGQISKVELKDGRAVVTMDLKKKYDEVYSNATMLLRPKTGLKDMVVELDPGDRGGGRLLKSGSTVPISQTEPDVNLDEILSALDADSRDYLQLLIHGAGQGLKGQSANLRAVFKRFDPTARDLKKINAQLAIRRKNISRSIHSFSQVTGALAGKDKDLARLVDASNAVFGALADQDQNLRATVARLPGTLKVTQPALAKTGALARQLGPALEALRPGARALGPTLRQVRPFVREAAPIIKNQIRPFTRQALPTLKVLTPGTRKLASSTGNLVGIGQVLNYIFNELTYDPPGTGRAQQGFLFYGAWLNHAGNTIFRTQDAEGTVRRTQFMASCPTLQKGGVPQLGNSIRIVNSLLTMLGTPLGRLTADPTSKTKYSFEFENNVCAKEEGNAPTATSTGTAARKQTTTTETEASAPTPTTTTPPTTAAPTDPTSVK